MEFSGVKGPRYDGIAMGVLVQPMVSLAGRAYAFIAFSEDAVAKNDKAGDPPDVPTNGAPGGSQPGCLYMLGRRCSPSPHFFFFDKSPVSGSVHRALRGLGRDLGVRERAWHPVPAGGAEGGAL